MSALPIILAEIVVVNSGKDVATAKRIVPANNPPIFVSLLIISACLDRRIADIDDTMEAAINTRMETVAISYLPLSSNLVI